jgi:hypothetical protein|tara:strand:- start:1036 stop:1662 length:627 start_codon:yes stop_codon:yes gene_type:complete
MSHRNLTYLNNNRIIYRRYSSDIPTSSNSWGWYYADGTHGYYALFNNKAKINTIRSLKWHLLTLWYLNPELDKNKFIQLSEYIIYKENGFVTFSIGSKLIKQVVEDVFKQDLDTPPKNRLRKIVFKDSSGLSTIDKLKIVGQIIGQAKGIKEDDIYEAMLYMHEQSKITIPKIADALKCTKRTIYRHMSEELKEEKKLLNLEYEKNNN